MQRMLLVFFNCFLLLLFLQGCAERGPCENPREKRDLFGQCYDPNSPSSPSSPTTQTPTFYADCLCRFSSGNVNAFFYNKQIGVPIEKTVRIEAKFCEHPVACEGGSVVSGSTFLYVEGTNHNTAMLYEFSIFGKERSKRSEVDPLARFVFAGHSFGLLPSSRGSYLVTVSTNPSSCKTYCSEGSFNCTNLDTEDGGLDQKLGALRTRVRSIGTGTTRIRKTELMQMFGVASDPCERSDTHFEGAKFTNTGKECSLRADVSSGGTPIGVELYIPDLVQGMVSVSGGALSVAFPDPKATLVFKISDAGLQAVVGGPFQRIDVEAKQAVVTTENGCIAVGVE